MRLLPIRKVSRQSKRLALTFCAGCARCLYLYREGTPLWLDKQECGFSVGLIQQNVSDVGAKVMTLFSLRWVSFSDILKKLRNC